MITAMCIVIAAWVVLFCVIAGLGQFVRQAFGLHGGNLAGWFAAFWIGYVVVIGVLQLWHLVLPIDWRICVALGIPGAVGFVWGLVRSVRTPREGFSKVKLAAFIFVFALALIPVTIWVANRALSAQVDFDTTMYHLSAIQWDNAYSVVPGLGNLHYRLAFNQTFFLFVAALNVYPFFNQGMHIANSLLLVVLAAQLVNTLCDSVFKRATLTPYQLLSALFLPVILYRASQQSFSANISSPSPDLIIFLLQTVVILAFVKALALLKAPRMPADDKEQRFTLFFIVALSIVGVTSKLSFLAFGVVVVALALGVWLVTNREHLRLALRDAVLWLGVAGAFIGLPWLVHGIVTSGYPLFPSTFAALPVDYRVPADIAHDAEKWVYSFAREPGGDEATVLSNWDWLKSWLPSMQESFSEFLFVIPFFAFAIALLLYVLLLALRWLLRRRSAPNQDRLLWLPLIPAALSALFWFFTAPDPRFAGAAFWILALWSVILLASLVNKQPWKRFVSYGVLILPTLVAALLLIVFLNSQFKLDGSGFPGLPQVALAQFKTDSGLLVNVSANPADNLELWNAALPASPYRLPRLALRGSDMRDGFRMLPPP